MNGVPADAQSPTAYVTDYRVYEVCVYVCEVCENDAGDRWRGAGRDRAKQHEGKWGGRSGAEAAPQERNFSSLQPKQPQPLSTNHRAREKEREGKVRYSEKG